MRYFWPLLLMTLFLSACSSSKDVPASANIISTSEEQIPSSSTTEKETALWETFRDKLPEEKKRIELSSSTVYKCNYSLLLNKLEAPNSTFVIPTTSGFMVFALTNANTMNEALAAKYPEIKSFKGVSIDGKFQARVDTNGDGLFVEVSGTNGFKSLLSPLFKNNKTIYAVYSEDAVTQEPRDKTFD